MEDRLHLRFQRPRRPSRGPDEAAGIPPSQSRACSLAVAENNESNWIKFQIGANYEI